jgi:phage-related protein
MNADQKSSNKALKTTIENHSKIFEDKFLQVRSEMKNLQSEFKRSQELHEESTKNLQELHEESTKNLQELHEESTKNLQELHEESTKNLKAELKKSQDLQEDSSRKIQGLDNTLYELLAHLKEEKKI